MRACGERSSRWLMCRVEQTDAFRGLLGEAFERLGASAMRCKGAREWQSGG